MSLCYNTIVKHSTMCFTYLYQLCQNVLCTTLERKSCPYVCWTQENEIKKVHFPTTDLHFPEKTPDENFGFPSDSQSHCTDQSFKALEPKIQTHMILHGLCCFCLFDSFLSRMCSYYQAADRQHRN